MFEVTVTLAVNLFGNAPLLPAAIVTLGAPVDDRKAAAAVKLSELLHSLASLQSFASQ